MAKIKELIRKIRVAIHDEDGINYDERDILDAVNAGMRFLRRTIAEIQPELIMTTKSGMLSAGENLIELRRIPLKIIELTAGDKVISTKTYFAGKKVYSNFDKVFGNPSNVYTKYDAKIFEEHPLEETTLQHVRDKAAVGKPRRYFRIGLKVLQVHPTPEKETAYTLRTVDDLEELKFKDDTELASDFDDFLTEYATVRLSLTNEYDMTQEQQIFASIHNQISQILSPPPSGIVIKSYW